MTNILIAGDKLPLVENKFGIENLTKLVRFIKVLLVEFSSITQSGNKLRGIKVALRFAGLIPSLVNIIINASAIRNELSDLNEDELETLKALWQEGDRQDGWDVIFQLLDVFATVRSIVRP